MRGFRRGGRDRRQRGGEPASHRHKDCGENTAEPATRREAAADVARMDRRRDKLGRARMEGVRATCTDSCRRRSRRCENRSLLPRSRGRLDGPRRGRADRGRLLPDAASSHPPAALDDHPFLARLGSREQRSAGQPGAASHQADDRPRQGDLEAEELGRPQRQAAGHLARPVPARRRSRTARVDGGDAPRPCPGLWL